MAEPRTAAITVAGLRTHEDVRLELGKLRVPIGENGSGNSSLLDAIEMPRKSTYPPLS